MTSISADKKKKGGGTIRLWAVLFWLLVWQGASMAIGQEILLVSPLSVFLKLFELAPTGEFWQSILFSSLRILGGFLLSAGAGAILAALSAKCRRVEELLAPAVLAVKAVPVASFIILILIWISSRNLSVCISFLMVFPVIYTNTLNGIRKIDGELLEMAGIFRMSSWARFWYLSLPQVMPYFRAGCSVGLGLCWKAGTAAEVIGIPDGSIGEKLYHAKVYLNTSELFAWTLVIILVSLLFEKLFLAVLDGLTGRLERM